MRNITFFYHSVNKNPAGKSTISAEKFRRCVSFIKLVKLNIIDLKTYIRHLRENNETINSLLTFDDGYRDIYEHALPFLHENEVPAVIFIITSKLNQDGYLTTNMLRELHSNGFDIGSHTVNHPNLIQISSKEKRLEMESSKKRLEDLLGTEIVAISYPKGEYNGEVMKIARECGYTCAFATRSGRAHNWPNRFCLRRYSVSGRDNSIKMYFKLIRRILYSCLAG